MYGRNMRELNNTRFQICLVQQDFFEIAKFPLCIGTIDCTHIQIRQSGGNEENIFQNRKQFF